MSTGGGGPPVQVRPGAGARQGQQLCGADGGRGGKMQHGGLQCSLARQDRSQLGEKHL